VSALSAGPFGIDGAPSVRLETGRGRSASDKGGRQGCFCCDFDVPSHSRELAIDGRGAVGWVRGVLHVVAVCRIEGVGGQTEVSRTRADTASLSS
jgi:hypothetical protein